MQKLTCEVKAGIKVRQGMRNRVFEVMKLP
jgi:hypothetical protein